MLGRLVSAFGVAALRGELTAIGRRLRLRAGLTVAAVVLWLLAFAFIVATLAVWLSTVFGPVVALSALAAIFALLALAVHLTLHLMARRATPLAALISRALAPLRAASMQTPLSEAPPVQGSGDAAGEAAASAADPAAAGTLMVLAVLGYLMGRFLNHGDHPPAPDH